MYILLAILGIGFLIFIHELGHYFMALWVGMRVEAFGIGYGRPIYTWEWKGVKWNLCWLPFGGYVRIAGMDKEDGVEPAPDSFFGKSPWDRIKVAVAGPLANFLFAFVFFILLWLGGGREKNYGEFSSVIGWLDPQSELYQLGIRPGDIITSYDGRPFQSSKDHLYAPMFADGTLRVEGYKIHPQTGEKTEYDHTVNTYEHPYAIEEGVKTVGIMSSGAYVIYGDTPIADATLREGSPMLGSGLKKEDRIAWVDGEIIYSLKQLSHILNDERVLLTVQRGNSIFLARVPRIPIEELKLDNAHRDELSDWQYESDLMGTKLGKLFFIPYNLNNESVVESRLSFIDKENQIKAFPKNIYSQLERPLQTGDRILAVAGEPVNRSYVLFDKIQTHKVNIIVERNAQSAPKSWTEVNELLYDPTKIQDIENIADSIGTGKPVRQSGEFVLLKPVVPKKSIDFATNKENKEAILKQFSEMRKEIEKIDNPEKRLRALNLLKDEQEQVILGLPQHDQIINYNPGPIQLFMGVLDEIWRTFSALFSGDLSPKWIAGPVGIVNVLQNNWMLGITEGLFLLAAISINLGVINLLPIPVLDGGHILICLFEWVTGRRLKAKTMERLIIPFVVLLMGFMLFVTFHDIARLFGRFFGW